MILFSGLAGIHAQTPNGTSVRDGAILLKGCGCGLHLPDGYRITAGNDRLVEARRTARLEGRPIPLLFRFLCAPNPRRTSMISDIRSDAKAKNVNIRRFSTTEIAEALTAAYYIKSRIHQGRVIQNGEGYFATLNDEYFLQIIPEIGAGPPPRKLGRLLSDEVRTSLESVEFFASFSPAITEANYRLRLYGASALLVILLGGGVLLLLRSAWRRRQARRAALAEAARDNDSAPKPEPNEIDRDAAKRNED